MPLPVWLPGEISVPGPMFLPEFTVQRVCYVLNFTFTVQCLSNVILFANDEEQPPSYLDSSPRQLPNNSDWTSVMSLDLHH